MSQLSEVEKLAKELMAEHRLDGWSFAWDRAKTRAGLCDHRHKRISLSAVLSPHHSTETIRNTILHEIAHALVGPKHGHNNVWRRQARAIGCNAMRCCGERVNVPAPWEGRCPAGHTFPRFKRPSARVARASCSICNPWRYDPAHLIEWKKVA